MTITTVSELRRHRYGRRHPKITTTKQGESTDSNLQNPHISLGYLLNGYDVQKKPEGTTVVIFTTEGPLVLEFKKNSHGSPDLTYIARIVATGHAIPSHSLEAQHGVLSQVDFKHLPGLIARLVKEGQSISLVGLWTYIIRFTREELSEFKHHTHIFWACMDVLEEKQIIDLIYASYLMQAEYASQLHINDDMVDTTFRFAKWIGETARRFNLDGLANAAQMVADMCHTAATEGLSPDENQKLGKITRELRRKLKSAWCQLQNMFKDHIRDMFANMSIIEVERLTLAETWYNTTVGHLFYNSGQFRPTDVIEVLIGLLPTESQAVIMYAYHSRKEYLESGDHSHFKDLKEQMVGNFGATFEAQIQRDERSPHFDFGHWTAQQAKFIAKMARCLDLDLGQDDPTSDLCSTIRSKYGTKSVSNEYTGKTNEKATKRMADQATVHLIGIALNNKHLSKPWTGKFKIAADSDKADRSNANIKAAARKIRNQIDDRKRVQKTTTTIFDVSGVEITVELTGARPKYMPTGARLALVNMPNFNKPMKMAWFMDQLI